jgi:hypothetical protein
MLHEKNVKRDLSAVLIAESTKTAEKSLVRLNFLMSYLDYEEGQEPVGLMSFEQPMHNSFYGSMFAHPH